ncbi:MAG: ABC transporter ATP-binding protein [Pseudomonadota bacterium]
MSAPGSDATVAPPAIRLIGITKRFGPVVANAAVDLSVQPGTIHGIVGENGAGKSTLVSILYGFYHADAGAIEIAGRPVQIPDSAAAIALGIGMVHQHFMLVPNFTVLENVMLGAEAAAAAAVADATGTETGPGADVGTDASPGAGAPKGRIGLAAARRAARADLARLAADYGLEVPPDAVTGDLPVGLQQRVEIVKALARGARVLILDEPTGVLTPDETDRFFDILRSLRAQGVTVLLITHKLREIMALCDNVSVMRQGRMVAHRAVADTTREELASLMVGRDVKLEAEHRATDPGPVRLVADALTWRDRAGVARLSDVSLTLRAGEILGLAGVAGNGQSELLDLMSGIAAVQEGRIRLIAGNAERTIDARHPADPRRLRAEGVAHVPEDRHRRGLVLPFAARDNAVLGYQHGADAGAGRWLSPAAMRARCAALMRAFDVRPPDPELRAAGFSGGNQQKLVLAREFEAAPGVLLIGQPTRGVDIGAIEAIHARILAMKEAGAAILLVSVELDEILALSDRIAVINQGRLIGVLPRAEADRHRLGLMMSGVAPTDTGPADTGPATEADDPSRETA